MLLFWPSKKQGQKNAKAINNKAPIPKEPKPEPKLSKVTPTPRAKKTKPKEQKPELKTENNKLKFYSYEI